MDSSTTAAAKESWVRWRLSNLAYRPESRRDLRLDLLRGFAVFAMVVDHLAGPSHLHILTGGNRFFTSAAEGFIFISGLLVGLVYRRFADRDSLGPALRRLLARALQLYVLAVGSTLIMLPASELLNLPWAQGIDFGNPVVLIVSIFTMHRTYYLVDVPLLYTLLLLVAPLALLLMVERRTWIVLTASWALWAGYQVFPEEVDFPWPIAGNYLFYFSAWQVLFFTAMVIGYHHERIPSALIRSWRRPLILVLGLGFLGLLLLFRYIDPVIRALQTAQGPAEGGESMAANVVEVFFAKGDLRVGRLIASAIVFGFLFLVTTEFWVPLKRGLGWLLLPLGQDALYAYSAHVIVALLIGVFTVQAGLRLNSSPGISMLVQLVSLILIWLAIRWRVLHPNRAHLRWWMASPGALAVLLLVILPLDPSPELPGLSPPTAQVAAPSARAATRVFGTPIPRDRAREAIRVGETPVALPPPPAELRAPAPLLGGEPRASEFVGSIQGVLRELQFYSAALDRDISYFIYLPPHYATEGRRYPVLYMLHGGSADKNEWPAYGLIESVDDLIDSKVIRPMIVVLPQGDFSYWMNHVDNGPKWGDYVAFDLVRHIDASFRSLPDPERRAIGGLSMGAHGALQLSFNHPDVFRGVGAHSPSLHTDETIFSIAGWGEEFAKRDPISLAADAPAVELLNIWIDVGEDDVWLERAELLHETLVERGIDHDWSIRPGGHEGEYWQRNLVDYLGFYDSVLNWRDGS